MTRSAAEFRSETLVAIDAVERALELARRRVGAADITAKDGRDLVTATDVAVEDAVRGIVRDALSFLVVGEERGGEAPADGSPYWLVDPICGTRNFASGMPLYCVNLALVEEDQVTVAVVGDPSTAEIHVAERGRGAWALKDGARRKLGTSEESRTIVVGRRQVDRRSSRARRAPHRRGHPGGSMARPVIGNHAGAVIPGRGPNLGLRSLLGFGHPHRGRHPPRYRGGRNPVRYRRPAVDHPFGFGRGQRQCSSPARATRPCPVYLVMLCHSWPR